MKSRTHTKHSKEEHCSQLSHFLTRASATQGSYKTQHWLQIEGIKKKKKRKGVGDVSGTNT